MIKEQSYAKINLSLKIVGKENGYHLIESYMAPISIYDEIIIEESTNDEIIGMDISMKNNLIYKAISLIRDEYSIQTKVKVTINKKIPMQAGLGGGSSNAACVLKMLNKIWNLNLDDDELIELGRKIGCDVPFFVINKQAFVTGFGEKISVSNNPLKLKGLLVFDNILCNTKEIYDSFDKDFTILKINELNKNYLYQNDLEKGLSKENNIRIEKIKKFLLENGAACAMMSGSGGSVFGIFENEQELIECEKKINVNYNNAYIKQFVLL